MVGLTRGRTAKLNHDPAMRPPKLKGRVANDLYNERTARSAVMPPPTMDTQEPRLSRKGSVSKSPMIKALEAIPTELQILINNYRVALNRQQKHG